ncbi:hypothetical protein EF384_06145 [Aerococcus agrisoli]|uniref:Competence protein ComGF n=1 Tax=Aerococcus agrisoli TaxID=2487350 RepID=A0A3N4GHI6_9LACT|nr:hypothetical protein [Aerococcus agrisoli]RPA60136.1 hypothetical protein EF384_06145 [Aerococcus agrisoli]
MLEAIYGLFFYLFIQLIFMVAINSQLNLFYQFEIMAYDDVDMFILEALEKNQEASFYKSSIITIQFRRPDGTLNLYQYYRDSSGVPWIIEKPNDGYVPRIRDAKSFGVEKVGDNIFKITITLQTGKSYQFIFPLKPRV